MRAEIISVGTELLLGEIVDTNSAWLAARLADRGVDVYWSQRVGDNLERIRAAVTQALGRSDLVLVGGGLGPTPDDLTREAVAAVLGETPRVDPDLERELRAWFARGGRSMPDMNRKQAWLIPSAEALPNPLGTAPGWLVRVGERRLVALPGPPREMQRMWQEEAAPRLAFPPAALYRRTLKTVGLGESRAAELLGDLLVGQNPTVATYARADGVHVRVAARAAAAEQARKLAAPVVARVESLLAGRIWGYDDEPLGEILRRALLARGQWLSTIESLTGGMVAEHLTAVPGISQVYRGGAVSYGADSKRRFGVAAEIIDRHGTVAEETARAMAEAAAAWFDSDYAVATSGVAGPDPLEGKPPGTVFVAVRSPGETRARRLEMPGRSREMVRERTVAAALSLLWEMLAAGSPPSAGSTTR